jgi:hypothetical protein
MRPCNSDRVPSHAVSRATKAVCPATDQVQQLAEDTIAAAKKGSDSWLTLPLHGRSTAMN